MKVIKIILGIIIAISIVFFATGLIVKETTYMVKVEINKPIAEVFSKFNDTELLKEWIPEVKSLDIIEEKPGKVGSTYKMIVKNQGQEMAMTEKVLAFVENEKVTLHFDADGMLKTDDYNFISEGNKTIITQDTKITAKSYILGCTFPWFKGQLKKLSQDYLERFKTIAEE
ncbi:1,4-dihydroxy-2-naphthoate prenyltransferase [Tenacibaculum sp. 190130A14a]|uniref:1,4-dihydroxy-2-naphthoate prenyltransferase n=1 Tax=Tenacibaculum polynesiense TaxID=3137857 RepID=A0ABM9P8K6_9FLAO